MDRTNGNAIAEALQELAGSEEKRRARVASGFRNAARFSWTKTASQVLEVYQEVYYKSHAPGRVAYGIR